MHYDEPLFRPPSEAYSLIFQVTLGCSWNRCAFCEMYTSKEFRVKPEEQVLKEISDMAARFPDTRKVFLADGDAMVLSSAKLMRILQALSQHFPRLNRVSAYAMPRNMLGKSPEELRELRNAGLKLIYVGLESGDDEVLEMIGKGESFCSSVDGLLRAHEAGIQSSVMILTGLGGQHLSRQHAERSAALLNETQPHFASTLVLSLPFGRKHFLKRLGRGFDLPDKMGLLDELQTLLEHCDLRETIFRSDHASNYLALKGILNRDKARLLEEIAFARSSPGMLRKEWMRGL
jgi:radical SAM superfamily enzyme YgiQ (UPF0313 family)